jgi:hypothetical protein
LLFLLSHSVLNASLCRAAGIEFIETIRRAPFPLKCGIYSTLNRIGARK